MTKMGNRKRYDAGVTKKASAQDISQSSSKGSENDKEANPRKKWLRKVMTKRIRDEL